MVWHNKALIGAVGGVALVLLKLIEVQFFVDDFGSKKSVAACLTYGAYIFLGIVVAVFFTDDSLEEDKKKRSAFIAGLLAPSVLLAVLQQPHQSLDSFKSDVSLIPKISELLIQSTHAQAPVPPVRSAKNVAVVELKKADVQSGFAEGFRLAIGRPEQTKDRILVLGKADNKEKALEAATQVNRLLTTQKAPFNASAQVMRPEGTNSWYVTVGEPTGTSEALLTQKNASSTAVQVLTQSTTTQVERNAAKLVLDGKIVNGASLFRNINLE